jgi:hypothetical protein
MHLYRGLIYIFLNIHQTQNDWLRQYMKIRQSLLFEMIRLEAPPTDRMCTYCKSAAGTYRCKDCFPQNFSCARCCVSDHAINPFHSIQRFTNGHFEDSDLDELGLFIDIRRHGHDCFPKHSGASGAHSEQTSDVEDEWIDDDDTLDEELHSFEFGKQRSDLRKIVVVASTGILERSVKWCTCPNAPEKHIQLLRSRLFPATFINPKTAFTFEVLDHFRLDALECNTSALNFMSKLTRRTNEIRPGTVPVFLSCVLMRSYEV